MLKFFVVCVLLTTASAIRRGFGHSRVSFTPAASRPVYAASAEDHADVLTTASEVRPQSFYYQLGSAHGASSSKASEANAEVISSGSKIRPDGFDYYVETTNGVRNKASGDHSGRIHGNFQWVSPEGEHVSLSYVADENGYQPDSSILPTPPPIPKAILKSLEYNKKHPHQEEEEEEKHEYHYQHHQHHEHQYQHHHQHQHRQQPQHHFHYNRSF